MNCDLCGQTDVTGVCDRCSSYQEQVSTGPQRDTGAPEQCIRSCTSPRRHTDDCPVDNHQTGVWTAAYLPAVADRIGWPGIDPDWLWNGDLRSVQPEFARACGEIHIGRYGNLQEWRSCRGCAPRRATYGILC